MSIPANIIISKQTIIDLVSSLSPTISNFTNTINANIATIIDKFNINNPETPMIENPLFPLYWQIIMK